MPTRHMTRKITIPNSGIPFFGIVFSKFNNSEIPNLVLITEFPFLNPTIPNSGIPFLIIVFLNIVAVSVC